MKISNKLGEWCVSILCPLISSMTILHAVFCDVGPTVVHLYMQTDVVTFYLAIYTDNSTDNTDYNCTTCSRILYVVSNNGLVCIVEFNCVI